MDKAITITVFLFASIATITSVFVIKTLTAIPLQPTATKKPILPLSHIHPPDPNDLLHPIHSTQVEDIRESKSDGSSKRNL